MVCCSYSSSDYKSIEVVGEDYNLHVHKEAGGYMCIVVLKKMQWLNPERPVRVEIIKEEG